MPAVIEGATCLTTMEMSHTYVSSDNAMRCTFAETAAAFHCCMPAVIDGATCHRLIFYLTMPYVLLKAWTARYDTWLLTKLTPKGVVCSFLVFSFRLL